MGLNLVISGKFAAFSWKMRGPVNYVINKGKRSSEQCEKGNAAIQDLSGFMQIVS